MALGDLSIKYESNGDPSAISTGEGDAGGISYGLYQLSSKEGSVNEFLGWALRQDGFYKDYARALVDSGSVNSDLFIEKWKEIGNIDPGGFRNMQNDYIKHAYYDVAKEQLSNSMFHLEKHSLALQEAVFSASVQYGNGWDDEYYCPNMVRLLIEAMTYVPVYKEYWNLSYVDDIKFDYDLIVGIYETRKVHPWLWKGQDNPLYEGLFNRFENEKNNAIQMFVDELKEKGLL